MWTLMMLMLRLTSKVSVGQLQMKLGATHFCESWRTADAGCWMRQGRKDPDGRIARSSSPGTRDLPGGPKLTVGVFCLGRIWDCHCALM